jgi:penicillin-insensitive murein DD-endopeptidase
VVRWLARVAFAGALGGIVLVASGPTLSQPSPQDAAVQPQSAEMPAGNPHAPTPGNVVQPIRPRAPVVAAKSLFGAATGPAPLAARAIGNYSRGCLAGARQLAVDGPAWQAMRLSRNRNWGHPNLVALVEKLALEARAKDGWSGLMVGDMSQPRGGPMLTGHASHQIGLDADIWFTPMPDRRLTGKEREEMSAVSMLQPGDLAVDNKAFTPAHVRILKRTASYTDVERVLVHPAIKKAICEATAQDSDRAWLAKVRPIWGHYYHFHIRIGCPPGSTGCVAQKGIPGDDGCGKELADWYKLLTAPPGSDTPEAPKPPLTLEQLPSECRVVLQSGR